MTVAVLWVFVAATTAQGQFVTNKDAKEIEKNVFQLTPDLKNRVGTVWFQHRLNLNYDFTINASLFFGVHDGEGADGIAFVLQPLSANAGSDGESMGFGGITPSLNVEFDTYQNPSNHDPAADHFAIHKNGSTLDSIGPNALTTPVLLEENIEDGGFHDVQFEWKASTKTFTVRLSFKKIYSKEIVNNIAKNIFGGNPYVYWGFTAGTGFFTNKHIVQIGTVDFVEEINVTPSITPASCPASGDGSIAINVTGGVGGYSFSWTGPNGFFSDKKNIGGLKPGDYNLTVKDKADVTKAFTFTVVGNDVQKPVITTPAGALNTTVKFLDASALAAALAKQPEATDNCGNPTIQLISDGTEPNGSCAQWYRRIRKWRFSDASSNVSDDYEQTITIIPDSILYVRADATGANNGSSWADAFTNLQTALNNDCPGTTQIWVAKGTYYPDEGLGQTDNNRSASFYLRNGVAIYGGFAGTETQLDERNWLQNITILSGDLKQNDNVPDTSDNAYHVVQGSNVDNSAVLDGFTITGGNAAGPFSPQFYGGGLLNYFASPAVANCLFVKNIAIEGAGVDNINSSPVIHNCHFEANIAYSGGGGMSNNDSSPLLVNCSFAKNSAFGGGGMHNVNASPTLINCSFAANATASGGSAIANENYSLPALANCIVWNNATPSGVEIFNDAASSTSINNSIVKGGYAGTGNIDKDPLFVNASAGDLHLQACSPAINTGNNSVNGTTTDLDEAPRRVNTIDMGAYEFQGGPASAPSFISQPLATQTVCQTSVATTISATAEGTGITYQWYRNTTNSNTDGAGIDGATSSDFAPPTTIAGTFFYYVVASGTCQPPDTSEVAQVIVEPLITYYRDADGDGFGDPANSTATCSLTPPAGYLTDNTDCNDNDQKEHSNQTWYIDADGDRIGSGQSVQQCLRPANGHTPDELLQTSGDCNDADGTVWRLGNFFTDSDNDGFTVGSSIEKCYGATTPAGFQPQQSLQEDCNDNNDKIFPATIVYINTNAPVSGKNNGSSWDNAFRNLQDAIANAGKCDNTKTVQLWVAKGTYYPDEGIGIAANDRTTSFALQKRMEVYGGFAGGETDLTQRNVVTNATTLSGDLLQNDGPDFANNGDNAFHVLQVADLDSTALLEGFIIIGGNANGSSPNNSGGGILNTGSSLRINNCTFTANAARFLGGGLYNVNTTPKINRSKFTGNKAMAGGAVCNQDTSLLRSAIITDCNFTGNGVSLYGGAVYNIFSSPVFTACRFTNNSAYMGGGFFNLDSSNASIFNCIFEDNKGSNFGGGIYNLNSSPDLTNCSFVKNAATNLGGGMDNSFSSPLLINCSFSGNSAARGGGIDNDGATPTLRNCILWGDTAFVAGSEIFANNSTSIKTDSADVQHSIVRGGYSGFANLNKDPLFRDTAIGDLSLKACSPAIDKGIDSVNKTRLDLADKPRHKGDSIDMGAYEFQGPPCVTAPLPVSFVSLTATPQGNDIQVTWIVAGETGLKYYVVEHSIDGRRFSSLGEVKAANKERYDWLHLQAGAGLHYYRIRSVEMDGHSRYSPVVKVMLGSNGYIVVAPNPLEGARINLQFIAQAPGRYTVRLVNNNGQLLLRTTIHHAGGNSVYPLQPAVPLAAGMYQLQIELPSGERRLEKLLKQ